MGRLTDDMTRLVAEIQIGHGERERLVRDLKRGVQGHRREVARMMAGSRAAHLEMARRQRQMLRGFVSDLAGAVGGLRRGLATDLDGARKAWRGAATIGMAARGRRGAQTSGGVA